MIGFANNVNMVNSGVDLFSPFTSYPFLNAIEPMEMGLEIGLSVGMERPDLEELLDSGVSQKVVADQLLIANRVDYLLGGILGLIEDSYFSLGKMMSGNSRHSLVLMCSYGDGSPLKDLGIGRYWGNDFLKGEPIDLMGGNHRVKRTLREIRSKEGIGSLVINGSYNMYHSGVQLPNVDLEDSGYQEDLERGSKTEAIMAFSKKHPTDGSNPVWFYRMNGARSIIQNGAEYKLRTKH